MIGNVSDDGDIELSLAQHQTHSRWLINDEIPIKIEPGTKDLVLTKKLDKEGAEGEQGIIIGVKCKKKHTNDPSIIIPIRILITDANDNEPEWLGLPYVANISEVTLVGSVIMQSIRAIDRDQQGPFSTIVYSVQPGPYSHMLKFANQFDGQLILESPLDHETLPKFSVIIRAQDQGDPPNIVTTTVTINVLDADDQNPRFLDDKYTAILPDAQHVGEKFMISPRAIEAEDPDAGIRSPIIYSFNSDSKENSFFAIDSKFGEVTLKKPLPPAINLPLTLVVRATQIDNRDRYALTTLMVLNRRQLVLPDIRFVQSNYSASLLESIPPGHVLLTVHTTRSTLNNADKHLTNNELQFQILDDDEKHFTIKNTGEIILTKSLDYEKHKTYSFRVMISDGRQSDVARVTVNVINVNEHDPLLNQNSYVFHVSESRLKSNSVIGEIYASDADDGDVIHFSLKGPHARIFTISNTGHSNTGHLKVKNIKLLNNTECHLIVQATDSGLPPRSASASVVVYFSSQVLKSFGRNIELDSGNSQDVDMNMLKNGDFFNPSSSSAIILVVVLGVLLGTLFIIIIALTMHVLKHRKYDASNSASSSTVSDNSTTNQPNHFHESANSRRTSSLSSIKHNKISAAPNGNIHSNVTLSTSGTRGVENPIFNMPSSGTANCTLVTRFDHDSAIVSDASSNETVVSNLNERTDLIRNKNSLGSNSPPPPPPNLIGTNASRISVVKWPQGSIPRRVKKLTWEDERRNDDDDNYHESSLPIAIKSNSSSATNTAALRQMQHRVEHSDMSAVPLLRTLHSSASGLPDLTVYF